MDNQLRRLPISIATFAGRNAGLATVFAYSSENYWAHIASVDSASHPFLTIVLLRMPARWNRCVPRSRARNRYG